MLLSSLVFNGTLFILVTSSLAIFRHCHETFCFVRATLQAIMDKSASGAFSQISITSVWFRLYCECWCDRSRGFFLPLPQKQMEWAEFLACQRRPHSFPLRHSRLVQLLGLFSLNRSIFVRFLFGWLGLVYVDCLARLGDDDSFCILFCINSMYLDYYYKHTNKPI